MDTLVNGQHKLVPALVTSFSWLYKRDITLKWTISAAPSWLNCDKNPDVGIQFNYNG